MEEALISRIRVDELRGEFILVIYLREVETKKSAFFFLRTDALSSTYRFTILLRVGIETKVFLRRIKKREKEEEAIFHTVYFSG